MSTSAERIFTEFVTLLEERYDVRQQGKKHVLALVRGSDACEEGATAATRISRL